MRVQQSTARSGPQISVPLATYHAGGEPEAHTQGPCQLSGCDLGTGEGPGRRAVHDAQRDLQGAVAGHLEHHLQAARPCEQGGGAPLLPLLNIWVATAAHPFFW